jgi:hypothetical protein
VLILGLGYVFAERGVTWARVLVSSVECAGILEVLRRRGLLARIYKA